MHRCARLHRVLSFCFLSALIANAQIGATLHTRQTSVKIEAGTQRPRLLSLQAPGLEIWANADSEHLIDHAEVDGRPVALQWKLDRAASNEDGSGARFVYQAASPRLRLTWEWKVAAGSGPLEHSIHIENLDPRPVWLPLQDSFRFKFAVDPKAALKQMYVDKGAGKPTEIGTHDTNVSAGYNWEGLSSTYAMTAGVREIIPWFMVQRTAHDGWYVGIEFSGRTHLTLSRDGNWLSGVVGLNPNPGLFRTHLLPGETFDTPTVFVGAFSRGPDGLGNVLRPWIRQVLNHPETWSNPSYPTLVNNSWGSLLDIDEAKMLRTLADANELGLEMFHIDAGWFRAVGDWYPDPVKFPHGLAPIADEAHKRGMKFGIWVNWTQAGVDTEPGALNMRDPKVRDWLVQSFPPDWKPGKITGITIDIGAPEAKQYADREVERIVHDYHLDMLEHDGYLVTKNCSRSDHPHAPPPPAAQSTIQDNSKGNGMNNGMYMEDTSNSTDVSYHSTRAYYDIYSHLRQQHPELLLEACNDGGRMVDFGSAAHADYFSITDSYDPLSNRRAFYDASHVLPTAMLEDYVEKWPTPHIENFRYMLRSGMMGWLTVMQDTSAWTAEQHAAAKEEFDLYKSKLRPLIRDAALYHVSGRPDGAHWDGIEYYDSNLGHGVVYAFRGTAPDETRHTFPIYGLRPERMYRLHFNDHSSPDQSISGRELMANGLKMNLVLAQSSELVFLDELEER